MSDAHARHPDTRALQALADKVEAGEYYRGDNRPANFNQFSDDLEAAGFHPNQTFNLIVALRHGRAAEAIRALIAGGRDAQP